MRWDWQGRMTPPTHWGKSMNIKLFGIVGAGLLAAAPALADPQADALLAAAKAATGGKAWDKLATWHESGKLEITGLDGQYQAWIDLPGARRADAFKLGALAQGEGWDGKSAWSTDSAGQVRVEAAGDTVSDTRQQVYGSALAYWYPERMPSERVYAGERSADGVSYDAIKVTPKGAEPLELWIERKTHRISRSVQLTGGHPRSEIYSDFRKIAGVTVPFQTRETTGDPKFDIVSAIATVEVNKPIPAAHFAPPPPPKDDAQFPAGADQVSLPFDLVNNHIYLPVSLNGGAPIPTVFDTGAINVLNKTEAAALGLKDEGSLPGGGFGEAQSATGISKVAKLDVGGLTLKDQVFLTIDLSAADSVEGRPMNVVIGYEIAKRAVTVIDYAGRKITFMKPASFHPSPNAVAVRFKFNGHVPMIQAAVDGVEGEFEIDTGARSSLTLMGPFSEAHDLVAKYHATRNIISGYGVGGPTRSLLFRPGSLKIGALDIKQPVGDLQFEKRGAAADPRTAGNIGGGILHRFTLTLDYGHQMLYLEPNADFAAPDVADRSGLWITRAGPDAFEIADVVKDSPASQAGLAIGDKITAIDGTKASALDNAALRERLKAAPGTVVKLTLESQAGPREVAITLADLV
jgi:predicted aspartyl protease